MTGKEFYKWYHGTFLHDLRDYCVNDTEFTMKVEQCRTLFSLDSCNPSYDDWKIVLEEWIGMKLLELLSIRLNLIK